MEPLNIALAERHQSTNAGRFSAILMASVFAFPYSLSSEPGSGGFHTPESAVAKSNWIYDSGVDFEPVGSSGETALQDPADTLIFVRDSLGLNITDLAGIFQVARPTVYAWLNGTEPKAETLARLYKLECLAKSVSKLQLPRMNKLVHRPLSGGVSLFEMVRRNIDANGALAELATIAVNERKGRARPKGARSSSSSAREVIDQYSIPSYSEV